MRIAGTAILLISFVLICSCQDRIRQKAEKPGPQLISRTFAHAVGDSFTLFLSLPEGYDSQQEAKYPVVYLTDANFFFEMMVSVFRNYAEGNLIPQVILVGIGYRDFAEMDSLRDRDFTFPTAQPEYEMQASGGAERFLAFISGEVVPQMDRAYHCDTTHRILMGHSLGGYFVAYTFLQQLMHGHTGFSGFVAASPSLYYNHYYLFQQLSAIPRDTGAANGLRLYVTYGGLEDGKEADVPGIEPSEKVVARLTALLDTGRQRTVVLKSDVFSNLGHMDMPIPSFLKGLAFVLDDGQKLQR